jgi:putative transposase
MSNYRRPAIAGGTYFITQVTYQRIPWLCSDVGRKALREAIAKVREKYPFEINAFVLLPDHSIVCGRYQKKIRIFQSDYD